MTKLVVTRGRDISRDPVRANHPSQNVLSYPTDFGPSRFKSLSASGNFSKAHPETIRFGQTVNPTSSIVPYSQSAVI